MLPALLKALDGQDIVFVARDEPSAMEMARALQGGAPDARVIFCPGSDALPGDDAPPSPANAGQRATALRRIRAARKDRASGDTALVTTGEAVARLYPAPPHFDAAPPTVARDQKLDLEQFAADLIDIGYIADDRVDEPGEVAVRGQVIDIFPADAGEPYRIEVENGRVISIRAYDPMTQLTDGECETLELGRVREPELRDPVTLFDHLPDARIFVDPAADRRRRRFLALAADAARRRPDRAPRDLCTAELWDAALNRFDLSGFEQDERDPPPRFVEQRFPARAFRKAALEAFEAKERVLLLGSARDLRFLSRRVPRALGAEPRMVRSWREAMDEAPGSLLMLEMPVQRGFRGDGILAVAAADLLGSRAQRSDSFTPSAAELFSLGDIRTGDVVVHEDHGIAVITGIQPLNDEGGDALVLRFAGDSRRWVPVVEAGRIWRYGAEEEAVSLDKLDGSTWEKRRRDIDEGIAETARQMVKLAQERLQQSAPILDPDPAAYERFASGFAFTETADQLRAIEAVRDDLLSGKPMDRLIVGDVGYGKTEVALRAAALAALSGKQVALAAPTTVLARQHLDLFRSRFADLGVEVAGLSRFTPTAEKKRVVEGLKQGSIRVVVGTRAVVGKAVAFHDLGLVIIDEEQKFGAADKRKLRAMGAAHVLTLSATPIPRTLQTALVGLQQLSIIATPPAQRQPIRTTIGEFDPHRIRTALLRERSRGGQSFVVVPRIEDLEPLSEQLTRLVPELKLVRAHGQMPAAEIDEAMVAFAAGEGDVLLATNIIESGLDVPRANTMIVWRADRFGLSQLHQLRGRVGRGARRGQIYLLTESGAEIGPRTLKRLKTLQAHDRLGAGFAISARDLDLRGAGDLLGEEQTGHVKLIGVDLYQHLLQGALKAARGEAAEEWTPVLNFETTGHFPEQWVPEEDLRVGLYVRLARLSDISEFERFEDELVDRFGEPPEAAQSLLALARLRLLAQDAGIARIDAGPAAIAFTPRPGKMTKDLPTGLEPSNGRLLLKERIEDPAERFERAEAFLIEMTGSD